MPEKKSKRRRLRLSFIGSRRPSLLPPPPKRSKNKEKENKTTDVGDDKKVVEPDLECKKFIEEELIKWKSSLQSNIIVDAEYSKVYDERCPSFNLEQEMSDLYELRHDWEMDVEEYNRKIKELVVTKELVAKRLEKQCVELKSIAQDHNKNDLTTPRHLIKKILNPT